jgi:hypothetical protein
MASRRPVLLAVQILLTLTAFEFFGPIVRDFNATHAMNPSWVGHARLHLMWLLGFMLLSGMANLYLIWFRRPFEVRNLWLSAAWQCCNLGGFWIAALLAPSYGGLITIPGEHVHIFGWDENVFVFAVLSILMAGAMLALRFGIAREAAHAAR